MRRSVQEVVELVVFALIALLVGTGLVWLAGWILGLAGTLLTWLAGLVWSLLRFLVPIALVAGAVYLLVRLMNRSAEKVAREPQEQPMTPPSPWNMSKEPPAPHPAGTSEGDAGAAAEEGAAADATPSEGSEAAGEAERPATEEGSATTADEAEEGGEEDERGRGGASA
jgi:predicted lipid-binding transport protein (Tim44 family)